MMQSNTKHPIASLPTEDLDLIAQLVLKSGSIKDLAGEYRVSYPTMRTRLDRVIDRVRAAVEQRPPDPVSDLLADLVRRGELSVNGAKSIRQVIREQTAGSGTQPPE